MRSIIPVFSNSAWFFATLAALSFAHASAFGKPDLSRLADHGNARLAIYASATPAFSDSPIGAEAKRAVKRGGDILKIIKDNNISNPIRPIAAELAIHMAEKHGFQVVSLKLLSWRGENRKERAKDRIKDVGQDADYILLVTNVAWLTLSEPGNLTNYLVSYPIELELVEVKSGKVMIKSAMSFSSKPGQSFDSRGDDGAKIFKAAISEVAEDAIQHYTKKVLK